VHSCGKLPHILRLSGASHGGTAGNVGAHSHSKAVFSGKSSFLQIGTYDKNHPPGKLPKGDRLLRCFPQPSATTPVRSKGFPSLHSRSSE
jgi:hypothetical protein